MGAEALRPETGTAVRTPDLAEFLFQLGEEGRAEKIHHGDLQAIAQLFQGRNRGAVSQGKEKPPLCKGGTAWQSHAGGIDGIQLPG